MLCRRGVEFRIDQLLEIDHREIVVIGLMRGADAGHMPRSGACRGVGYPPVTDPDFRFHLGDRVLLGIDDDDADLAVIDDEPEGSLEAGLDVAGDELGRPVGDGDGVDFGDSFPTRPCRSGTTGPREDG